MYEHEMLVYFMVITILLEVEDLVLGLLDDDVKPDTEICRYDVHHSESSYNNVTVLDDLDLNQWEYRV